ncbi:MAG TPA: flagellar basal body-associated FliL family protein [Thermodesulfovibrionales bacterium]|jgi:flagellar FliL protein|nr:flagellar basal body-associated FliL family protein [Thermodesulfovibrionales bacterium]
MADEKGEVNPEETKEKAPAKSKKMLFLIAGAVVLVLAAGFITYTQVIAKTKSGDGHKAEEKDAKTALVSLDPFVLNLAEQGRFLKVSMQFELSNVSYQPMVADKVPQMRDAIITLVSSKSSEAVSSPEGKFQLKDELLLRANQAVGKDVFKNLYFTEFVMQ